MTWVIGLRTIFGYAAVVSDVQVTWGSEGPSLDCLKKAYPIAPFLAAGFAGSVRLGFLLLSDLHESIHRGLPDGYAVNPRIVAIKWWRRARRIFSLQPDNLRQLGSEILLAGVSLGEREGDAPWPRSDVITFSSSSNFEPRFARGHQCLSTGSGKSIEAYTKALEGVHSLMQLEVGNSGGMGFALGSLVSQVLRGEAHRGISKHVHVTLVRLGSIETQQIKRTDFTATGEPVAQVMPPVAHSWDDFESFAYSRNLQAGSAAAGNDDHHLSPDTAPALGRPASPSAGEGQPR